MPTCLLKYTFSVQQNESLLLPMEITSFIQHILFNQMILKKHAEMCNFPVSKLSIDIRQKQLLFFLLN